MTTLELHPHARELGGIESARGPIELIVTKEAFTHANTLIKNVSNKAKDLTRNKVTAARESTEELMGDFIASRTLWGVTPEEYAAAVASTEVLMNDFVRKAL